MRLIDADALKFRDVKVQTNEIDIFGFGDYLVEECKGILQQEIWNAPTIDAEPVRHGRWVVIDAEEPRRYGCSECKRLSWNMENYCGNCGARMDGGNDE